MKFKCDSLYHMLMQHLEHNGASINAFVFSLPSLLIREHFVRKELCVIQESIRKCLNVTRGLSFIFLRKLMSKVSEFYPALPFFLPVSVEAQQLILVLQIKLFSLFCQHIQSC